MYALNQYFTPSVTLSGVSFLYSILGYIHTAHTCRTYSKATQGRAKQSIEKARHMAFFTPGYWSFLVRLDSMPPKLHFAVEWHIDIDRYLTCPQQI
jgi:hypothetical protein